MTPVMASLAELIRRTEKYKDNYEWFVELAKNFHWIQSQMVESVDKVKLNYRRAELFLSSLLIGQLMLKVFSLAQLLVDSHHQLNFTVT